MLFAATYANAEAKMSGTLEATLGSGEAPAVSTKTKRKYDEKNHVNYCAS
jgi:hypothetical protein